MADYMKEYKSCQEYLKDISDKLKLYRVAMNLTQQDLADKSGVSLRSISRLEQGSSVQLDNFIKIMAALDLDKNLDMLIPDQRKRPSYYLEENKKVRQRVRRSLKTPERTFKWGDEQ